MRVGFAGLGRMGGHMARNLATAGHNVTLWNRSTEKSELISQATGCDIATTPKALADLTDVVITMLSDDEASDTVHLGPEGLFEGKRARVLIEMGTMSPDHVSALANAAPADMVIVDAPVSGSTQAAADRKLLILAGCTVRTAAPIMPLFEALGREVICLGKQGAGAVMKLAVNSLIHGINQNLAEAMTLAEAAGIPSDVAFDSIEASAACAPMLKYRRPLYLDEAANEVTFTVSLARKDMSVTSALAKSLGVAMPQGDVTLEKLRDAEAKGFANRDMASILNYMREENQ
ncbi:NAD(P)-dependent oxidoreductase [Falsihalocynthiibacter arcticus]|uniref:NAD(P)-dependent oxidoreductase n=1 Tax=Falsihalocynthiibacter arcticus TaxID=1579316 RepID=UPI003003081A